jgi:hypothetical protein
MLCVGLGTGNALAQSAPSAGAFGDGAAPAPTPSAPAAKAPPPDATPADVVRLKNGGLLRGNISELVPGGTVTIVTMTGGTRTFNMSEVAYAGPAAQDPQAAPAQAPAAAPPPPAPPQPYVTVHAAEARIQFHSVEEDTTFYRRSGAAYAEGHYGWARVSSVAKGYERICTAPCEASLPSGRETIAFGHDNDDEPKELDSVTLPPGNSLVSLSFKDRGGVRTAGVVTMVAGAALGVTLLALLYVDQKDGCHGCDNDARATRDTIYLLGGGAAFGIAFGVGIPLIRVKDKPTLDVSPSDSAARRLDQARGLTFSGTF